MEQKAVEILDDHRIMGLATVRPDGWPQATMVGYANEGLLLYFVISREGQKFANLSLDTRVSIVIGRDFKDPSEIRAISMAANADEVRDPNQREHAIDLIIERHPELAKLGRPDLDHSAVMRAYPAILTILDYSKGFGHTDVLTVAPGGIEMTPVRDDDWGFSAATGRRADQ